MPVQPPSRPPPVGLQLTRTARSVTQAFERAMAEAGGSAAAWQVLLLVRSGQSDTQAEMAEALGLTGATLTHHLNALEPQGLVRRWREPGNRRVQQVELTEEGVALFDRLRGVAQGHDRPAALDPRGEEDGAVWRALLEKLQAGVDPPEAAQA